MQTYDQLSLETARKLSQQTGRNDISRKARAFISK